MRLSFFMKYQLLIIDGYNLIHQDEALKTFLDDSLESARKQLANKVARIAPTLAKKCVLVFDGQSGGRGIHRSKEESVEIIFSPRHQTADTIIERIAHCAMNPERICVVTSDHAEQMVVSSAGVHCMSCQQFIQESACEDHRARNYIKRNSLLPRGPRLGDFFPDK